MKRLVLQAPAKINLCLEVLGRREDGYHDLFTVMHPVDLYDEIELTVQESGISVTADSDDLPQAVEDNLVYRGAQLFFSQTGLKAGVHINLKKRIPIAAGLGGGSSDAASVLMGLSHLFDVVLPKEELQSVTSILGADVSFFLHHGTCVMGERGDTLLAQVPSAAFSFLLVKPRDVGLLASDVYRGLNLDLTKDPPIGKISYFRSILEHGDVIALGQAMVNDLELVAIKSVPILGMVKQHLVDAGAVAAMVSGSGPTVFALLKKEDEGQEVRERFLQRMGDGFWSTCCKTVGADGQ